MLPPSFATVGAMGTEPASLNEALQGPYAKEWQAALDYEIGQLEKLGTWVMEDLPKGTPVIPCTEVLKKKRGPTGVIESYRVWIVAGRHKQVEGINYMETFLAASKMPSVHVVLANATQQDWEIRKKCLPPSPTKGDNLYEAAVRGFEARAGGQGMPPAKRPLRSQTGQAWVVPRAHKSSGWRAGF